jgi:hypothetical protein
MPDPRFFAKLKRKEVTPRGYWRCFDEALLRMLRFRPGNMTARLLNESAHDSRLTDEDAAEDDFYSSFEYRTTGVLAYTLTRAFFRYSYNGLVEPPATRRPKENRQAFLRDCATNYLVKNFWHNHVHECFQKITSSNYHDFKGESRYSSDFAADNLGNVLHALSYGHVLFADDSDQTKPARTGLHELFQRNRCNRVFAIRDEARIHRKFRSANSIDALLEAEWLIRRRLANEISIRCIERGRALASISVHLWGPIRKSNGHFQRPNAQGSVEMNGIRIPLYDLGNISYLRRDEVKEAVDHYVTTLDTLYATHLRSDSSLRAYARDALKTTVRRLVACRLNASNRGISIAPAR